MSLAQELDVRSNGLYTGRINAALRNHNVEEIVQFIRSNEHYDVFFLHGPPVNEELGRHVSDAIVQNSRISWIRLFSERAAIRDVVAWIAGRNTLVNMTSLETVWVVAFQDMSVLDCTALFPLLLTSTSLRKLDIYFGHDNGCSDDVMSALSSYIGTASLREFEFSTNRLSEAAFAALCNHVALSTVRQITLGERTLQQLNLEMVAESLARMIVESSLEDVVILGGLSTWSETLKLTAPVRNLDFAFTQIGNDTVHLRINRKWKPLIFSANTPLALWPHIFEKSHASPETSHGSADILFYVLTQKPDLVPSP